MANYQVLYWNEIPAQVRAEDAHDDVSVQLDPRFEQEIDRLAMERGVAGSEEYLDGWKWSEFQERAGSAKDVADAVKKELEAAH